MTRPKFQQNVAALDDSVTEAYRSAVRSAAGGRLQPPTSSGQPIYLPCHILSTYIEAQMQRTLGLPPTAISYSQACCRGGGGGGESGALGRCCVSDGSMYGGQECV